MEQIYATGRRKESTARIFLRKSKDASGKITVNKRTLEDYFPRHNSRIKILTPLRVTGKNAQYDIVATVSGGGITGQAEAIRHGISLALRTAEPGLAKILRDEGLVTRDSRIVERKKVGLHKARRATQFSKR